ncbi:MAG TPA: hypothetical protein VKT72_12505 [Candidatus Baltobacteraceae bacterium]|nr:hypothetical protein [Candidatus Baltobacteraceae bacterium]
MSTDPLSIAISARVAAAEAAMLEAAISIGASAELLQAQISTGDVLTAVVLPPQNGQDFIEILGQRVAAQLPPGVNPGETLLLQVTGFSGTQIYVRNLGAPDPQNPPEAEGETPPQTAVLTTIRTSPPQQSVPQQTAAPQQRAPEAAAPISPPREVFVAASVRQAPAAPTASEVAPAPETIVRGVEARIAAAQAANAPPAAKAPPVAKPPPVAMPQTAKPPPVIPARTASAMHAVAQAVAGAKAPIRSAAAQTVQRVVQTVSEFLRAARVPDTPFTRMAAAIASQAPERLPSVLQRLEAALPSTSDDPRVGTLRTLIGFTARLNPANAETLRAQISAYLSNVVEGVETKLTQLLQAHKQASPAAPRPEQQTQAPGKPSTPPPAPPNAPVNGETPELPPTVAQARVAERSAAIDYDLKSVVLSLLRDPTAARTPAMTQALTETAITLTGAQVNTLSFSQQNPGTFTLSLPVFYHEGGKPAQIRISRDGGSGGSKMDADNFHVAFVLDTANLGTVAIDLQTTGRTVKVDVKTETDKSAVRFADSLSSLRTRLEDLRYRVASAVASALPAASKSKNGTVNAEPSVEKKRGLDLRA